MLTCGIGNDVREHARDVVATLRGSDANLFETGYGDVWSAEDRLSINQCVRALIETHRDSIKTGVGVAESLVEIVHPEKKLVGQA